MRHLSEIQISILIISINIFSCILNDRSAFLHFLHFTTHLAANIRQCFKGTFSYCDKTLSAHFFFSMYLQICTELLKIFRQFFHNDRNILILAGKYTHCMIWFHKFSDYFFESNLIYLLCYCTFINFFIVTVPNRHKYENHIIWKIHIQKSCLFFPFGSG